MKPVDTDQITDLGFLSGGNMTYLESLYQETQAEGPGNGELAQWKSVFASLPDISISDSTVHDSGSQAWLESTTYKQARVLKLIMTFRSLGHLLADVDPIGVMPRGDAHEIQLDQFNLSEKDLDTTFDVGGMGNGGRMTLRNILKFLHEVYCQSIGYEIRYINALSQRTWLLDQIEIESTGKPYPDELRVEVLDRLTAAEGLEKYLHTKYVGQKRFSLEGGDSLIPMLSDLIQQFGSSGVKEVVIGMAHRGRLNVLVNILGKSPAELFSEFEGSYETDDADTNTGDVKYHQGASSDIQTPGGIVHVALSFNPSHLEIISPVVEGSVRARQERRKDSGRKQVIPILVHGDAAFAGQGVVMETLNMAQTRGFSTGGTVHIIVNNQIGFTTNTLDARSTLYCTEVAKLVQAPIFHVNGDDPDAVIYATRMAMEYRMKFCGDVVLDLVCYRRHGHNEADEPAITQPIMYGKIKQHKTTRQLYADKLVAEGVITENRVRDMVAQYRDQLDRGQIVAGQVIDPNKALNILDWKPYMGNDWREEVDTGVSHETLVGLAEKLAQSPDDFVVHKRVESILQDRISMAKGDKPMDWGCGEVLAYASLLDQRYKVRLSGQDVGRGTFSHRHATLHDQSQPRTHIPLQYLTRNHSDFLVINSLLSEEAVLGFEYGYSTTEPRTLVIWEAQFGDFVNGAQVVIDQFISSGQAKWSRICSLVMLLPHGLEGQGPEHSSARLERFLQLCAEHNMQVCIPTTPAQMFHMLRRQMMRSYRRPLIVMTPKSLLRHKLAVSAPTDLEDGKFCPVLGEIDRLPAKQVRRLIICSGKVYYDLLEERRTRKIRHIAIVRLEQVHPFPDQELRAEMEKYPNAGEVVWCQEEPKNQGCWYQIYYYLSRLLNENQRLRYIGREGSPSPAVGYYQLHVKQQQQIVSQALAAGSDSS
ncbi:MAG: 2-oxoglutarate dehydrogenase E1 component [Gammaproteobacteria bacterium]|nr:2-oxoglutarate dehydrogenase E1 component [Gammaproteobacteria bacterium]